jgi:hypothetical protein
VFVLIGKASAIGPAMKKYAKKQGTRAVGEPDFRPSKWADNRRHIALDSRVRCLCSAGWEREGHWTNPDNLWSIAPHHVGIVVGDLGSAMDANIPNFGYTFL